MVTFYDRWWLEGRRLLELSSRSSLDRAVLKVRPHWRASTPVADTIIESNYGARRRAEESA